MDTVRQWLRDIRPQHALFVFDACYSGNVFERYSTTVVEEATLERLSRPAYEALSSSASNQQSYGYSDGSGGVFTRAFLNAARGGADDNGDGFVTRSEIAIDIQQALDRFAASSGNIYDYTMSVTPGNVATSEGEFFFIAPEAPRPTEPVSPLSAPVQGTGVGVGPNCAAANHALRAFNAHQTCNAARLFLQRHGDSACFEVDIVRAEEARLCAAPGDAGNLGIQFAALPADPRQPTGCASLVAPEGTRCEVDASGNPYFIRVASARPPAAAVRNDAFGIPAERWSSGTPGADLAMFREGPEFPEMVVIPAGSYRQGSTEAETTRFGVPDQFAQRERPQRTVRIARPFALARTEVTVGEWRRFVRETGHAMGDSCWTYEGGNLADRSGRGWDSPGFTQGEDHPVACVSWEDAQAYVNWLNGKVGLSVYRLPSESEWEYAARAGTQTARYWGEDAENTALCRHANGHDATSKR